MKFVTTNEIQFIQEFPLISFVMKLELTNEIQEIIKKCPSGTRTKASTMASS